MNNSLLPDSWKYQKLEEIGTTLIGLTYSPSNVSEFGTLVLRSSNIQNNQLAFDNNVFVDMELPDRVIVKENDLLICVRNGSRNLIGKCTLIDKKTEGSAFGAFMSIFRSSINEYVFHVFQSEVIQKQIRNNLGATINQITNNDLANFYIPVPPLSEQQKIAQALTDADNYISSLEKLIEKKKQLKEASLISIFDFNNAEWEVKPLSDLCTYLNDGTHYTPRYTQEGIPFYSVENVTNNEFTDVKYISKEEHETLIRRCKPENGDILMTRIGSVGVTKLIDWDINASIYVSLALLKFKNREFVKYFYAYSKTPKFLQDTLSRSLINATPQKINMNEIGDIPVYFPKCQNEQVRIANIILNLEKEIEVLNIKLSKAKFLKQGMMQKLLTGEIRLA